MRIFKRLEHTTKGKCEVRLSSVYSTFGLTAFDPHRKHGLISVEIMAYKRHPECLSGVDTTGNAAVTPSPWLWGEIRHHVQPQTAALSLYPIPACESAKTTALGEFNAVR